MKSRIHAFSLIEVVLALGIISFAMVAILSLFSVGLTSSRQSSDDTVVASMSMAILSNMRGTPARPAGSTTNYYFDKFGQAATNAASGYYDCFVKTRAVAESEIPTVSTNLIAVDLVFSSPSTLPATKRPYTNSIYATIPSGP